MFHSLIVLLGRWFGCFLDLLCIVGVLTVYLYIYLSGPLLKGEGQCHVAAVLELDEHKCKSPMKYILTSYYCPHFVYSTNYNSLCDLFCPAS